MKKLLLLVMAVVLIGCASSDVYQRMTSENRQKLNQLRLEMPMNEVASMMGTEPLSSAINQSYRTETLKLQAYIAAA